MADAVPVPAWAASYEPDLFREFLEALNRHFRGGGGPVEVTPRGIRAGGRAYALHTLADLCRHMPRAQWPRAIAGHFRRIEEVEAGVAALRARKELLEVGKRLRVRIYPERFQETDEGRAAVTVPVAPGIVGAVEIEADGGGETVAASRLDAWGVSAAALFEAAKRNHVRRRARKEGGEEFEVGILMGEDAHVATEMLFLEHYVPEEPPAGTLVVVPTQGAVIWHEVRSEAALQALQTLVAVSHQLYERGPGSLLPMLYWWRRGKYFMLPMEVQGESIRFSPPVEFVAALEDIGVNL